MQSLLQNRMSPKVQVAIASIYLAVVNTRFFRCYSRIQKRGYNACAEHIDDQKYTNCNHESQSCQEFSETYVYLYRHQVERASVTCQRWVVSSVGIEHSGPACPPPTPEYGQ